MINCTGGNRGCKDTTEYWQDALPAFLQKGFLTFIADGIAPCNIPSGVDEKNLHEYNGKQLGIYLDDIYTRVLNPLVAGNEIQVDLFTHSMGGLTSRAYIASDPEKKIVVRTLIMAGTPNGGSKYAESKAHFAAANFLTRDALREFNNLHGDPSNDVNGVRFFSIGGSGGPTSMNWRYRNFISNDEPHPVDGAVSRQSLVHYDVPDAPPDPSAPTDTVNSEFRTHTNCQPDPSANSCITRIASEKYLCTGDDHDQLITNASTLDLAQFLFKDQDGPGGEVTSALCPDVPMEASSAAVVAQAMSTGPVSRETRVSSGTLSPSGVTMHNHLIDISS